jgi:membrane dipeptidase
MGSDRSMTVDRVSYGRSIVVDLCAPVAPFATIELPGGPEKLLGPYLDAGVSLIVLTVVDDLPNSIEQTIKLIAANRRFFLGQSDRFVLVDSVNDVHRSKAAGRLAVAFAFQGSNALLGELALVEVYRRLGVVQMLLAYNLGNLAADGCHEKRNAGLTQFGRDLVAEMNRVGMIVDLSHVGLRSSLDALELTTRPPVFSHSTPKKFAPHDRNITDDQIRSCAAKDGVVGLTGVGLFMDSRAQKATVSRMVDTIEYVVQLVGPQHAGIGLDYIDAEPMARYLRANSAHYGGGGQYPTDGRIDFAQPSLLPEIADELARRGYSADNIRGILGQNYLRVLDANRTIGVEPS